MAIMVFGHASHVLRPRLLKSVLCVVPLVLSTSGFVPEAGVFLSHLAQITLLKNHASSAMRCDAVLEMSCTRR
ncbi:hypothetical protein F5B20DRAFT_68455 [Whalleya microplaca]|nr:hypothetical protein F5B20DRAFT_68455 [Whalleya microplaca]